jgi:hypothetical protein
MAALPAHRGGARGGRGARCDRRARERSHRVHGDSAAPQIEHRDGLVGDDSSRSFPPEMGSGSAEDFVALRACVTV